jgi:hypothetical protein
MRYHALYRDKVEHTGKNGAPIQFVVTRAGGSRQNASDNLRTPVLWPVDDDGLPTGDYLDTLTTKAKWERFLEVANERSQLHGLIHLTNLSYGEPE